MMPPRWSGISRSISVRLPADPGRHQALGRLETLDGGKGRKGTKAQGFPPRSTITGVPKFSYRANVLAMLRVHGVIPAPDTPPELVRGYVRELYKYELRRLRDRYVAGEFPKRDYWARVDALRRQYPVLALRAHEWVDD